jgi:SdiA-regulated
MNLVFVIMFASYAPAELVLLDQFSTNGGIGLAFDRATDTVWTYGSDTLRQYSRTGTLLNTINNAPGESANDADLDFADLSFTLGTTSIPAGTLLFTNGETNNAEVYAISPTGTLLATLSTGFGNSHVVGSAYSPQRGTFFMVQDRVPSDPTIDNLVAEIDTHSGAVLNSFDLDTVTSDFTVNFGDLEVSSVTGNLLIVSTDETEILELSPAGVELSRWALASGASGTLSASGIALDDLRNEVYVQTTGGTVYRYAVAVPEPSSLLLCTACSLPLLCGRRRKL